MITPGINTTSLHRRTGAGKRRGLLETAHVAQGVKTRLPVLIAQGSRPGPLAVVTACQHGRELNGIASIARAFEHINTKEMTGCAVFLPIMNPLAIRAHQMDFPLEKLRYRHTGVSQNMNMNRAWRKNRTSTNSNSYIQEITDIVWKTYLKHADVCLDLHAWTDNSLSLAMGYKKHLSLLKAFGLPWFAVVESSYASGSCTWLACSSGIPSMICELTPQNMICPETVAHGERGIMNLLKFSGILSGEPERPETQYEFGPGHKEHVIKTDAEGLLVSDHRIGDPVTQGETVLSVLSLDSLKPVFEFKAPCDSLLFNLGGCPFGEDSLPSAVVYPGQMVGLLKQPTKMGSQ
ncbi:MAG: succinylglutamate desuccinylase/aspartoacylase family protein [Lentisphaerae bacterium]|nr:succinylglutamate desuccinylase/aspartoacylase family protein [Lentisphaerota bacterium]